MDYTIRVSVFKCIAETNSQLDCPIRWQLWFVFQYLSEASSIQPLHNHVDSAAVRVRIDFHNSWMIQLDPNLFLALKPIRKHWITLGIRMGNLDGNLLTG